MLRDWQLPVRWRAEVDNSGRVLNIKEPEPSSGGSQGVTNTGVAVQKPAAPRQITQTNTVAQHLWAVGRRLALEDVLGMIRPLTSGGVSTFARGKDVMKG